MSDRSPSPAASSDPIVRDEDGEVSLRFDDASVQSRMRRADPAHLVLEYTRLMMGCVLFQPTPVRLAMIGLGGGSLARYCGLHLPAADVTVVEISPAVIALRDAFGIAPDGPRFRVLCEDGAAFVRRDGEPLDVLLVDGFDCTGQPAQLCSAAFYDACRARLAAGGVLVVNLHSDEPDCDTCLERIGDAFAGRMRAVTADGSANTVVFASPDAAFPPPFRQLVDRLRALQAAHPIDLDATVRKLLQAVPPHGRRARRRSRRQS